MFRTEFSERGGKIEEIEPEKVTPKTVTFNGRRENKQGGGYGSFRRHKWFYSREDAERWLVGLAATAVDEARTRYEEAEAIAVGIDAMSEYPPLV